MVTRLAGLASWANAGRSTRRSLLGWVGFPYEKEPPPPSDVNRGVAVAREVGEGASGGVGEGVQVGKIRMRGVTVFGMGDGEAVWMGVAVGVLVQPASMNNPAVTSINHARQQWLYLPIIWAFIGMFCLAFHTTYLPGIKGVFYVSAHHIYLPNY